MIAGRTKRILLVEDEPTISEVCLRILSKEFEVGIAVDGSVAKNMVAKKDYDVIIIDIVTPVMDGKQLYQSLVEEHPELVTRVIFTTGDIMGGDTKSFIERSARPLLLKPFTPAELLSMIQQTLCQMGKSTARDSLFQH